MFFNWYMKQIRFPSGTGNAGLALIPTNCGCLRHHRPCFKSRVDLWYLASSDLGESSLCFCCRSLQLQLRMLVLTAVSDHSPRTPPGELQKCVKAFTCPWDTFGWEVPYKSIKKRYLSYFFIVQALKKEQECLTLQNLEPSLLFQSHVTHLPACPSEMGGRKPSGIWLLTWSAFVP